MSKSNTHRIKTYQRHINRLETRMEHLKNLDNQLSRLRLIIFLGGLIGSYLITLVVGNQAGWITAALGSGAFILVVFNHRRIDRIRARFETAKILTKTHLARIQREWAGIPEKLFSPVHDHPFANDLNLTGEKSIHQLIDTAISKGGTERLRSWLLNTVPDPKKTQERRKVLEILIPRWGFRNHLSQAGMLTTDNSHWDGEELIKWLEKRTEDINLRKPLILLSVFAFANLAIFVLSSLALIPAYWLLFVPIYFWVYLLYHRIIKHTFADAYHLGNTLTRFQDVLKYLETYPYSPESSLKKCCDVFTQTSKKPSSHLKTVTWIASAASLQGNPFIWLPLNLILPWDLLFTHLLNQQKRKLKNLLPVWLDTWYELEALCSLANFSHLNPETTFPQIEDLPEEINDVILQTHDLGHPLIPNHLRVCNDFELRQLGTVVIITGSNMSGKSTFLRTLGINLVLAFTGGTVQATQFKTIPLRLYTAIQVSDSLAYGISYFYAEVNRLKGLLDTLNVPVETQPFPLLFLIDEIFRGTNNKERRIGSQFYVKALLGKRGVGLISTHDLELTSLAEIFPKVHNLHFRETIQAEKMMFDYQLHPGPCPTTNALRIMAMAGLPIEDQ